MSHSRIGFRLFLYLWRTGLRKMQRMATNTVMVMEDERPETPARRHLYMSNQLGLPSTRLWNSASNLCPSK